MPVSESEFQTHLLHSKEEQEEFRTFWINAENDSLAASNINHSSFCQENHPPGDLSWLEQTDGLLPMRTEAETIEMINEEQINLGYDPQTVNPYYKGFKRHKNAFYRNHLCIPKQSMNKVCSLGGWEYFRVYIYILMNHNKNYTFQTTMKMICDGVGIKKNKTEKMNQIITALHSAKIIDFSFTTRKQSINSPIAIKILPVKYPYQYFYIKDLNFNMVKDYNGGWIMFSIYCLMECYRINKSYNLEGYESQRKCIISQDIISKTLKISRGTVIKYTNQLVVNGYLSFTKSFDKENNKYFCNIYHLFNYDTTYCKSIRKASNNKILIAETMADYEDNAQFHPIVHALDALVNLNRSQLPAMISGDGAKMLWNYYHQTVNFDKFEGFDESFSEDIEDVFLALRRQFNIGSHIVNIIDDFVYDPAYSNMKKVPIIPISGYNIVLVRQILELYSSHKTFHEPIILLNLGIPPMHKNHPNENIRTFITDFIIKAN